MDCTSMYFIQLLVSLHITLKVEILSKMYNISYSNVFVIFKTYSPHSQLFQPGEHSLCTEERFVFEDFCRLLLLSPSPSQPSI